MLQAFGFGVGFWKFFHITAIFECPVLQPSLRHRGQFFLDHIKSAKNCVAVTAIFFFRTLGLSATLTTVCFQITEVKRFWFLPNFLMFTGFTSRTLVFTHDNSGLALVTPSQQVYFPFDTRFFNRVKTFCISLAQLFSGIARLRSIYTGLRGGYFCVLHVKGIGFKVFLSVIQRALYFFLGYNHLTKFKVPATVTAKPLKNHILLFTFRNDFFGSTVYHVRRLRFPDPYRGKGIRYRYQIMRFKPGKQR
jgi:hypothetical protein